MATDTVTTGSDDTNSVGSLRYELAHAQAGDIINFAPGVTSVALASTLTISQNVTIDGGSAVTVAGGGASGGFSDFTIAQGVHATLDGLTITNGAFVGQDESNAAVSPTPGGAGGGAITDDGTLTLGHSTISGNSAIGGNGSNAAATDNFYKGGGAGGSAAGGVYVASGGVLELVGRTDAFARNTATGGHGGKGGYSTYADGGQGGAGATATTGYAHGPSINRRGMRGLRGERSNLARGPSGGGAGGRPGMNGADGHKYRVAAYYAPYTGIGAGGGGGGGNAFSDFGGTGTVKRVAAARATTAAAERSAAVVASPACFTTGTSISTCRGDVAVEALRVGDLATTASGRCRPIRWIGHRDVDCSAEPVPSAIWPVRIRAGAFGCDVPARDLLLSPGHPVLVGASDDADGILVPIMCLINGTTIARVPVPRVTYWHVELDAHDILLAEGLPAESYLEWGDRDFFTAGSRDALGNPDFVVTKAPGRCRAVAIDGAIVEAERRRLDAVFATRLAAASAWPQDPSMQAWLDVPA